MTDQEKLLNYSHRIEKGNKREVTILGKKYKLTDTKRKVLDKIMEIAYQVSFPTEKDRNKQFKIIQTSDVKVASYLILNAWSYIPLVHAIHWRYLRAYYTSETFEGIIETALNNEEIAAFLKGSLALRNLLVSRVQMIQIPGQE